MPGMQESAAVKRHERAPIKPTAWVALAIASVATAPTYALIQYNSSGSYAAHDDAVTHALSGWLWLVPIAAVVILIRRRDRLMWLLLAVAVAASMYLAGTIIASFSALAHDPS
jgi:hypothetical protein